MARGGLRWTAVRRLANDKDSHRPRELAGKIGSDILGHGMRDADSERDVDAVSCYLFSEKCALIAQTPLPLAIAVRQ